ncbi:MAG TPA: efflux RND transporter permease subunit [Opitutaceae bacterium]|nr:efflux RND transporter permease subunit [Opitutaceae bacterium]
MLQAIVQFSLRFRGIVVSLACLALAYGVFVATHAKLDVFPNFVPPEVTVQTEAPGLAPEEVETLVTRPVENALNGLGHQEALRSESIQGLSIITIVFREGTDVFQARQMLAEKIGEIAGGLPAGVKAPKMSSLTSATMDLLKIGLVSDKLSPMELRTFADWTLKPRLLAVSGVAQCSVFGGQVRQWQVQVHPDLLVAHGVALTDVLAAARLASGVRGAGFIDTPNQRILLQSEGQTLTVAALGNIVVATSAGGVPVRLRDVATVAEGAEPKFGDTLIMGRDGVLLTMLSQYGSNTMDVTRELEAALADLKPVFEREGIKLYPALHRPATFIEVSLANIGHSLLLGAALVAIVLLLFLGNIRTALISLTAIPLSLFAAITILDRFGVTLNTITLGGLAIALGEVVDDSIIDVENILRRLRENRGRAQPLPVFKVILGASLEVRKAVVYATFMVALVFLPVLTLSGLSGSFFAPLAESYILAIITSLLVALTVTPALTLIFFSRGAREAGTPRLQRFLRNQYEEILRGVNRYPVTVIGTVFVLCGLALSLRMFLGGDLMPEFREGHFVLSVNTAPGASLSETQRIGKQVSDGLGKIKGVATYEQQIGRAERGEDPWGPEKSEFHVELEPNLPGAEQARIEEEIHALLKGIPGIQTEVLTFLGDRIHETVSGGDKLPVVVNIFGDDLDALDHKADEVKQVLTDLKAEDVNANPSDGTPRIGVRLRADRLTELGFRPVDVLEAVQTAYEGEVAGQIFRDAQTTDVAVILDDATRRDPENVGALLLTSATGLRVPLREIADVYLTSGRSSISHEGARRLQKVSCSPPAGQDVQTFVATMREALAKKVTLPTGMYFEFAGTAQADEAAARELWLHYGVAAAGILMLLSVVLGHWRNLLLVVVNLPLALAGGVLAVYVAKQLGAGALSMGVRVGFVTLFGITTRNAIMMISHYEHLVTVEGRPWNLETAVQGASERLIPIMMTALVTALGLLPLALGSGEAGREIEGPMAQVILGGLLTSSALNLLVLPTLALRFARLGVHQAETTSA